MAAAATDGLSDILLFITLPNELLPEVTKYLEPSDLLNLRLVFPKDHSAVLEKSPKNLKRRIYLTPTSMSLDNFVHICNSPVFQTVVEEVVFVPHLLSSSS